MTDLHTISMPWIVHLVEAHLEGEPLAQLVSYSGAVDIEEAEGTMIRNDTAPLIVYHLKLLLLVSASFTGLFLLHKPESERQQNIGCCRILRLCCNLLRSQ